MWVASRYGMENLETSDALPHVNQVRDKLHELAVHLRKDASQIDDAKAAALFETSAEVISGLERAFEHLGARSEPAWRKG